MNFLLAHMEDFADKALETGFTASKFLTPAEAGLVRSHFKLSRVEPCFDGGFNDAERVRAVFVNPDWGEYVRTDLFSVLRLKHRDPLTHRDILGALMALGIARDTVGDIVCEPQTSVFVCLPELSGYIAENLTKAGRVGVSVSEIDLDELPDKQENLTIKTDTVASLRLDAMLCAAFGLPRSKAALLISTGRVNVDHQPCLHPAKELNEGTLLSVRGLGRVKLLEIGGESRKGRTFVSLGLYVR